MTRWRIEGTLTVREGSALHVGSGETSRGRGVYQRLPGGEQGEAVEVKTVATGAGDRAFIPGSTLKGVLRAWMEEHRFAGPASSIFGSPANRGLGVLENAFLSNDGTGPSPNVPCWDQGRKTGVAVNVAIERRTRTAAAEKLFHVEFVPEGAAFEVRVELDGKPEATEPLVGALLAALDAFNDPSSPLTLGAATGDGWGRMAWSLGNVLALEGQDVAAWLGALRANPGSPLPWREVDAVPAMPEADVELLRRAPALVTLDIALDFEEGFLVNDPGRTGPSIAAFAPLLDARGRAFLPASSFRGALRAQAERILRTASGEGAACHRTGQGACAAVRRPADLKADERKPCLACLVFGASGWRSPVRVTPFYSEEPLREVRQEFIAIDRFTGGGAEGLKYAGMLVQSATLLGRVAIDLRALDRAGARPWALALLAFLLRDLVEGDIGFGFGAAKGRGACRAKVTSVTLPPWEEVPDGYGTQIDQSAWDRWRSGDLRALPQEIRDAVEYSWLLDFDSVCSPTRAV